MQNHKYAYGLVAVALFLSYSPSASATIINGITLTGQNIFLDNRGVNDVGENSGPVFQFGGDIAGGSLNDTGAGIFTPAAGSSTPSLTQTLSACGPNSTNPNMCARSATFTTGRLNGSWSFQVSTGTNTAIFPLPSVSVIPSTLVPFPKSVTITNSANGISPTISWTLPAQPAGLPSTPNAFRINIFDRSSAPGANGVDNIIFSTIISPTATSFTIPTSFQSTSTSPPQSLIPGDKYSINFQVIDTRDGTSNPTNSNADILSRSNSFFDFTPQPAGTQPTNIQLPQVDGQTGVYHFSASIPVDNSVMFIDPPVAIGYIYDIGAGDPNFASVILPNVGDGIFDVSFLLQEFTVDAGQQFFFPTGGVSEFTVTGIEVSAGLDPANTAAFVTGLTFAGGGEFTGTMTPITEDVTAVPEPASLTLLATSLLGFGLYRRRRMKGSDSEPRQA